MFWIPSELERVSFVCLEQRERYHIRHWVIDRYRRSDIDIPATAQYATHYEHMLLGGFPEGFVPTNTFPILFPDMPLQLSR